MAHWFDPLNILSVPILSSALMGYFCSWSFTDPFLCSHLLPFLTLLWLMCIACVESEIFSVLKHKWCSWGYCRCWPCFLWHQWDQNLLLHCATHTHCSKFLSTSTIMLLANAGPLLSERKRIYVRELCLHPAVLNSTSLQCWWAANAQPNLCPYRSRYQPCKHPHLPDIHRITESLGLEVTSKVINTSSNTSWDSESSLPPRSTQDGTWWSWRQRYYSIGLQHSGSTYQVLWEVVLCARVLQYCMMQRTRGDRLSWFRS